MKNGESDKRERKTKRLRATVSNNTNIFHDNMNDSLNCRNGIISVKRLLFNLSRKDKEGIGNFFWRCKLLRTKDNLEIILTMISIKAFSATTSKSYSDIWLWVSFTVIHDHMSFLLLIEFQTNNSRRNSYRLT